MPAAAIFKGQTFCISGRLSKPKKEFEELIAKYGGAVSGTVTAAVTFLVSTEDDVKACTQKVATAQGRKVPIVQENFLCSCVGAKKLLSPDFFYVKGSKKRKAAAPGAGKAAPKRAKKEEKPVVTTDALPVIAKSGLAGKAAVVVEEVSKAFGKASITWDVEMVLNDPAKGKDKFYNMQLLANKKGDQFWVAQHWGRTGLAGAVHVEGACDSIDAAKRVFKRKYRQKTGNPWGQVDLTFVEAPGKYKLLARNVKAEAPGLWQYYLSNEVDGKKIGWYNYQEDSAKNMEKYWEQYNSNDGMNVRVVHSDYFRYEVNFSEMIQMNMKSGTRRVIRRVPAGTKPSPDAPAVIPAAAKPAAVPEPESSEEEDDGGDEDEDEDEAGEAEEAEEAGAAEEGGAGAEAKEEAAPAGRRAAEEAGAEEAAPEEEETLPMGGREAGSAPEDETLLAATLPLGGKARDL